MFIPPHLAEKVVKTSEIVRLRDMFGHQRLREQKYTPGQIDSRWSDEIEKDFSQWLNTNIDKLPVPKEQIQELLNAAKVSVFFIDDRQVVRPFEVGSSELIRAAAAESGAQLYEFDLEGQFRCGGSETFVNWVENKVPPATLLAAGGSTAPPTGRTRPLCPYPKRAIYKGTGDVNDANSFFCGGNLETTEVVCRDVLTKYKNEERGELDFRPSGLERSDCKRYLDTRRN